MNNNELKFPEYFPPNCPPKDAVQCEIEVYRLCENPVCAEDFLSHYQKNPQLYKSIDIAYGLSVCTVPDDCLKLKKYPALKNKKIARGITYIYTGVIKQTNGSTKSHYTWWLFESVEPHTYFRLVEA